MTGYRGGDTEDYIVVRAQAKKTAKTGRSRSALAVNDATCAASNTHEGPTFRRLNNDGLVVEDVHFTDMAGLLARLDAS